MRAVILAGGKGTRLRPYTTILPKPLLPIGDQPILEVIVKQLARDGFSNVDLCVGYLGELIEAYMSQGARLPAELSLAYHREREPLGTAGALRELENFDRSFLVMNGDILTSLDFGELMRFHVERDAALTVATHQRNVPIDLGVIETKGETITRYVEKPQLSYRVSMGIYGYEPRALEHIPPGHFDFPELVDALLKAGETVASYPFVGDWFDIGTAADYERAATLLAEQPDRFG